MLVWHRVEACVTSPWEGKGRLGANHPSRENLARFDSITPSEAFSPSHTSSQNLRRRLPPSVRGPHPANSPTRISLGMDLLQRNWLGIPFDGQPKTLTFRLPSVFVESPRDASEQSPGNVIVRVIRCT